MRTHATPRLLAATGSAGVRSMAARRLTTCARRNALRCSGVVIAAASALAGCATTGLSTEGESHPAPKGPIAVQVEPCIDRTETPERDLGLEATKAFAEKLRATSEFVVTVNARHRLACEVTGFVEGSAVKRWVVPGWGSTVGQVSAMLTDDRTGEILIIARGNATVSAGGLYTIGADSYIVGTAVDNVVEQLRGWARGAPAASGK